MIAERESVTESDLSSRHVPACRFCSAPLRDTLVDLGTSPRCDASFSPHADGWVEHARAYAELAAARLRLNDRSFVVDLASNDGYLLQHFAKLGVQVLGIDPATTEAASAERPAAPTATDFFGVAAARRISQQHGRADLIVGNNVLAHVSDLNDFVGGIPLLLAWNGTVTLEFPHLARVIEDNLFGTLAHDQFTYFSLYTTERIFAEHGLRVYDAEELATHHGSLRVWGCHAADARRETARLRELRDCELADGVAISDLEVSR